MMLKHAASVTRQQKTWIGTFINEENCLEIYFVQVNSVNFHDIAFYIGLTMDLFSLHILFSNFTLCDATLGNSFTLERHVHMYA